MRLARHRERLKADSFTRPAWCLESRTLTSAYSASRTLAQLVARSLRPPVDDRDGASERCVVLGLSLHRQTHFANVNVALVGHTVRAALLVVISYLRNCRGSHGPQHMLLPIRSSHAPGRGALTPNEGKPQLKLAHIMRLHAGEGT